MATNWRDPNALGDYALDAVGWSKIGEAVFELSAQNSSGFAQLGLGGEVLCVKKLGESVMVYADRGVAQFYPVEQPVVGFGKKHFMQIPGVAGRGAVAGNDEQHLFIDVAGYLWVITADGKTTRLGYQEFFRPTTFGAALVVHNPIENAFFISNGELSFRWDQYGLTRIWQAVTSCGVLSGDLVGLFYDIDNQGFEITTDVLDFGLRGRKTVTCLEVGGNFDAPVFAAVNWRNHNEKFFHACAWRRVNPQGFVNMRFTAEEFQIKLMSQSQRVEIDYINAKVQYPDKRFLRGPQNADSTNA